MAHSLGFEWGRYPGIIERIQQLHDDGLKSWEIGAKVAAEYNLDQAFRESQVAGVLNRLRRNKKALGTAGEARPAPVKPAAGPETPRAAPPPPKPPRPPPPPPEALQVEDPPEVLQVDDADILEVQVIAPPPASLPIEDLIEHRIRRLRQRKEHENGRSLIPVVMPDDQPIGILHFGDPHVDDDGCDLELLKEHCRIVRETPGMYAATVGDLTNNWVGRLATLYGEQATTKSEAWAIAELFISKWIGPKWLYLVGGNHDAWSGAGDPLQWICRQAGALYQMDEARVEIRFPGGHRVRINCRHDFPGRSIYNEAHGPLRWLIFNQRDHVAIAGHTHVSSHHELKAVDSGITMRAIRVAAYKVIDNYARTSGLPDKHLSPCVMTVINTRLTPTDPDLIKVFWTPAEGAKYLTDLRARARADAAKAPAVA